MIGGRECDDVENIAWRRCVIKPGRVGQGRSLRYSDGRQDRIGFLMSPLSIQDKQTVRKADEQTVLTSNSVQYSTVQNIT